MGGAAMRGEVMHNTTSKKQRTNNRAERYQISYCIEGARLRITCVTPPLSRTWRSGI